MRKDRFEVVNARILITLLGLGACLLGLAILLTSTSLVVASPFIVFGLVIICFALLVAPLKAIEIAEKVKSANEFTFIFTVIAAVLTTAYFSFFED